MKPLIQSRRKTPNLKQVIRQWVRGEPTEFPEIHEAIDRHLEKQEARIRGDAERVKLTTP